MRSRHGAECVGWPPAQCSHAGAAAAPGAPGGSGAAAAGVGSGGVWAAEARGGSTSSQALVVGAQPCAEVLPGPSSRAWLQGPVSEQRKFVFSTGSAERVSRWAPCAYAQHRYLRHACVSAARVSA